MIYLIDDNQRNQQQQMFNANYLFDGSYDSFLINITSIDINSIGDLKAKLQKADAIFLHNTYEDQDENGNYIKGGLRIRKMIENDIVSEFNIPLVLFSFGMDNLEYDYDNDPFQIKAIRKDVFYKNLYWFLENFKKDNVLDFRNIAYGKNFHVELAISKSEKIISQLKNPVFLIDELDFNDLRNYYNLTKSKADFNDFVTYIEDNITTINDFKEHIKNINRSLLKYGKNIHN